MLELLVAAMLLLESDVDLSLESIWMLTTWLILSRSFNLFWVVLLAQQDLILICLKCPFVMLINITTESVCFVPIEFQIATRATLMNLNNLKLFA